MNTRLPSIRSLSSMMQGETGEIIQIRGKPEVHRLLSGKGLLMGRKISVSESPASEPDFPLTVQPGNMTSVIDKDLARNIKVRIP